MDPPAVRGLALVLRLQAGVAEEAAGRITTALTMAGLTSGVSNRLVGRAEDWRLAAGVLETRATLAESFRIDLIAAPTGPSAVTPSRTFTVAEHEAQQGALDDVVNMTEEERAIAVAAMSDDELAALVDFANFSGQSAVVAGVLLPVIDDDRSASWSEGLPGVDSIADLNDRIENWPGSDNDPILDQLIAERTALIEALTNDDQAWNYDPEIAAFAELYGLDYEQAALVLDANKIAGLTVQIDALAGMPGPVLDAMVAERQTLIDAWLDGETFPPEIAAVILPLLAIPEIVDVERRFPGTVDIGRLNAVLAEHDANWHAPQAVDPEVEELRALRNALVAEIAGEESHLGLDPNIAALAQVNSLSYHEAEAFLILGEVGRLNHSIAAVGDGPVADAMIAERNALLERVTESDAASAAILGGLLDEGFPLEEAVMVMAAANENGLDFGAIADLARREDLSLLDAANMTISAAIYAMTPEELMAYQGFREHFSVIDNATGGTTDDGVSMEDLRHVVANPEAFDVEVVAAAAAFLALPSLRNRIDSAVDHSNVVNAEGSFGGTRYDDGFFTLGDLDAFEGKQTISFLVGENYDDIDIAHEGGATDGFLSKHDFEDFLENNRDDLSEEEIWALETVIDAEFFDQGWFERNKHALALAAAVVVGVAIGFATLGVGTGLSGALITMVAAGAGGAGAAGGVTLSINAFSSESDLDDDLFTNSFEGFFAGAGAGGAVLGVTGFAGLGVAGQISTGLGLVSDVTGLAGLGAFDLGLQLAIHPEDLDNVHDDLNRVSLLTGVASLPFGGYALIRHAHSGRWVRVPEGVNDFTALGFAGDDAVAFLDTVAGRQVVDAARVADPSSSLVEIEDRVLGWLKTGVAPPVVEVIQEPLIKIVPTGSEVSPHSAFFTTAADFEAALASNVDLADYYGLPAGSAAGSYDVYEVIPGPDAIGAVSIVAPTSQVDGVITTHAGGLQVIVPDRSQFSAPIHLATIDNVALWDLTGFGPNLVLSQVPGFVGAEE